MMSLPKEKPGKCAPEGTVYAELRISIEKESREVEVLQVEPPTPEEPKESRRSYRCPWRCIMYGTGAVIILLTLILYFALRNS